MTSELVSFLNVGSKGLSLVVTSSRMEMSKGVSCMNKNIIYKTVGVVILLLIGEGVFGWAVYWPVLWFLLEWKYVYWLVFALGFLLTGLTGLVIGWSSLVLVVGVWILSLLKGFLGKDTWMEVLAVTGVAWAASLVTGLQFSLVEAVVIASVMVFAKMRASLGGEIRV